MAYMPNQKSNDGRTRILEAAIERFAQYGYDGTTTSSISKRAKVAQPLIHHHFGSKLGLWQQCVLHLFDRWHQDYVIILETENFEELGSLESFVHGMVSLSVEHPELSKIILHEGKNDNDRQKFILNNGLRQRYELLLHLVTSCQARGWIRTDIEHSFLLTVLLASGIHFREVNPLIRGVDETFPHSDDSKAFTKFLSGIIAEGLRP